MFVSPKSPIQPCLEDAAQCVLSKGFDLNSIDYNSGTIKADCEKIKQDYPSGSTIYAYVEASEETDFVTGYQTAGLSSDKYPVVFFHDATYGDIYKNPFNKGHYLMTELHDLSTDANIKELMKVGSDEYHQDYYALYLYIFYCYYI